MAKQPACMLYVVPPTYWLGCVCKPVVVAARRFRWFNLRLGLLLVRADRFQNIAVQIVAEQRRVEDFFFHTFCAGCRVFCFIFAVLFFATGGNRYISDGQEPAFWANFAIVIFGSSADPPNNDSILGPIASDRSPRCSFARSTREVGSSDTFRRSNG